MWRSIDRSAGPVPLSVTPINEAASSFTATLTESNAIQTPDEYENAAGEKLKATPEGNREGAGWVTTGVASAITVHPSAPIEIRAITAAEVEAKRREAEARQHDEEAKAAAAAAAAAAAKQQQEEAAAKKRHEEEVAAANKKRGDEEALAVLKSALRGALAAKAPKLGALLKHGGFSLAFSSSEPGTLVIQWWQVPTGAHLAKKGKLKLVLVAQGEARFAGAGVGKVKIGLTRPGRRLLAHANKLKLTSQARFTPTGQPVISANGALTLSR